MFGLQMVNDMESIQREINQLFRGCAPITTRHSTCQAECRPEKLNLRDADDLYVFETPLPGIDASQLEISVLGRRLTLTGELTAPEVADDVTWRRHERKRGKFSQSLLLPLDVDNDNIEAEYQNGILRINLKKVASAVAKKIAVKAA